MVKSNKSTVKPCYSFRKFWQQMKAAVLDYCYSWFCEKFVVWLTSSNMKLPHRIRTAPFSAQTANHRPELLYIRSKCTSETRDLEHEINHRLPNDNYQIWRQHLKLNRTIRRKLYSSKFKMKIFYIPINIGHLTYLLRTAKKLNNWIYCVFIHVLRISF